MSAIESIYRTAEGRGEPQGRLRRSTTTSSTSYQLLLGLVELLVVRLVIRGGGGGGGGGGGRRQRPAPRPAAAAAVAAAAVAAPAAPAAPGWAPAPNRVVLGARPRLIGRPRPRDVAAALGAVAPGQLGGLGDADPWAGDDLGARSSSPGARRDLEGRLQQVRPVQRQPDAERLGQLAGARAELLQP